MTLKQLLPKLENEINDRMEIFMEHSMRSKQLRDELDAEYKEMKNILSELKYVLPIVKEQNPNIVTLLEELSND